MFTLVAVCVGSEDRISVVGCVGGEVVEKGNRSPDKQILPPDSPEVSKVETSFFTTILVDASVLLWGQI